MNYTRLKIDYTVGPVYSGHLGTNQKCPDFPGHKESFGTTTKCVDYAGVLIFKCLD